MRMSPDSGQGASIHDGGSLPGDVTGGGHDSEIANR